MNLTVYRQAIKDMPDGMKIYRGEDALPYVDDRILLVADGLGGAGAIYHQTIDPDLFDEDKIAGTLFDGVYDDCSDPVFTQYVKDSFAELRAVKDIYAANIQSIKKSGYFGSRIVSAAMLHAIIYDEYMKPDKLFDAYCSCETNEDKKNFLGDLSDMVSGKIANEIRKIAKNGKITYESTLKKLALLGTTICATVFREKADSVEALYFTAGDSRPYVWTEANGLQQILKDEEGPDGAMINYIKANEGETFSIKCTFFRFDKPCVLFNASDGCFDSSAFLSQMAFEKLILDKCVQSSDISEMSRGLYDFFVDNGRHDDSSTIAMRIFGYPSFEGFQESARRRLECINSDYLSEMPDLLDRNYISENSEVQDMLRPQLLAIKEKFENEDCISDFVEKKIKSGGYPQYEIEMRKIDEKISEKRNQNAHRKKDIEEIISRNFIRFASYADDYKPGLLEKFSIRGVRSKEKRYDEQSRNFLSDIEKIRSDFDETVARLKSVIDRICEMRVPFDFSEYDDIGLEIIEESAVKIKSLMSFLDSFKDRKNGVIVRLGKLKKQYSDHNNKLARENSDMVHKICDEIVSGVFRKEGVEFHILKQDKDRLENDVKSIGSTENEVRQLDSNGRNDVLCKCKKEYWNDDYDSIISEMLSDSSLAIRQDLRDEAEKVIKEFDCQEGELRSKACLQTELFEKYDASYEKYLVGENGDISRV